MSEYFLKKNYHQPSFPPSKEKTLDKSNVTSFPDELQTEKKEKRKVRVETHFAEVSQNQGDDTMFNGDFRWAIT